LLFGFLSFLVLRGKAESALKALELTFSYFHLSLESIARTFILNKTRNYNLRSETVQNSNNLFHSFTLFLFKPIGCPLESRFKCYLNIQHLYLASRIGKHVKQRLVGLDPDVNFINSFHVLFSYKCRFGMSFWQLFLRTYLEKKAAETTFVRKKHVKTVDEIDGRFADLYRILS